MPCNVSFIARCLRVALILLVISDILEVLKHLAIHQ